MAKILKCTACGEYTMSKTHCDTETVTVEPMKYSPKDPYGAYRRKYKKTVK